MANSILFDAVASWLSASSMNKVVARTIVPSFTLLVYQYSIYCKEAFFSSDSP